LSQGQISFDDMYSVDIYLTYVLIFNAFLHLVFNIIFTYDARFL
jgi:hypothetical protein